MTLSLWLQLGLGLLKLANAIFESLERARALKEAKADLLQKAQAEAARAQSAIAALNARFSADPGSVRNPDELTRPDGPS